jgi:epoxide hydrolase A/B
MPQRFQLISRHVLMSPSNPKFVKRRGKFPMIEMPPLKFARTNGIRMGFYEAGPAIDNPPLVLCHGWPELAFSWCHQIKALSEAGIRVIAPDQRGYGATAQLQRPAP